MKPGTSTTGSASRDAVAPAYGACRPAMCPPTRRPIRDQASRPASVTTLASRSTAARPGASNPSGIRKSATAKVATRVDVTTWCLGRPGARPSRVPRCVQWVDWRHGRARRSNARDAAPVRRRAVGGGLRGALRAGLTRHRALLPDVRRPVRRADAPADGAGEPDDLVGPRAVLDAGPARL